MYQSDTVQAVCSVSVCHSTGCMQRIGLPEAHKMLKTPHISVNIACSHPEPQGMSVHVLIPGYHKCL
jgi:hypothetical protein